MVSTNTFSMKNYYKISFRLIIFIFLFSFSTRPLKAQEDPVKYSCPSVDGINLHLVTVDLNDPYVYVTPLVPSSFDAIEDFYPCVNMSQIVNHYNPRVLINGTYFDMSEGYPIGNLVMEGELVNEGYNGSAVCIGYDNRADFILFTGCIGRYLDLSLYRSVICSGPTLVYNGRTFYFENQEGHDDPGLYRNTRRSVLGITEDNRLLIVGIDSSVSMKETGYIMMSLGAKYACNLDGGTSSGLYVDGKYLMKPGRSISNYLAVFNYKPSNLYIPPSLNKYFEEKQKIEAKKLGEEGEKCFTAGYYYDALDYFIEACEKNQENPLRYLDVARTYSALGDYEGESKFIAKASMAFLQRGFIFQASYYANKALKIDPKNETAIEVKSLKNASDFIMGRICLIRDEGELAEKYFLRAIESSPEEPRFYYALAGAYWKLSMKEKASETYLVSYNLFLKKDLPFDAYCAALNGVRTNPHNKAARIALAEIAIKREKYDSAVVHLQIAFMLDPADEKVRSLLKNLGVRLP